MTQPAFPNIAPFVARELVDETHLNAIRAALRYLKGIDVGTDEAIDLESPLRYVNVTTVQRDLLPRHAGSTVFNTTTNRVETWNGTGWVATSGGTASAIDAIVAGFGLDGGGSEGTVEIAAGAELATKAGLAGERYYWADLVAIAGLAEDHFAVTAADLTDVGLAGWGANNLVLHFPARIAASASNDPRQATLASILDGMTVGTSIHLSTTDPDNHYVVFETGAEPILAGGNWRIPLRTGIVTGTPAGARWRFDFNTPEGVPVAADNVRFPGDFIQANGTTRMPIVVRDGSFLREIAFAALQAAFASVVANPEGTDGEALTRIQINGVNWNIAGGVPPAPVGATYVAVWSSAKDNSALAGATAGTPATIPAEAGDKYLTIWTSTTPTRLQFGASPFNELTAFGDPTAFTLGGVEGQVRHSHYLQSGPAKSGVTLGLEFS